MNKEHRRENETLADHVKPDDDEPMGREDETMDAYTAMMIAEGITVADEKTVTQAWQYLIDTGIVWQLQGWYGRTAAQLIENGVCTSALPNGVYKIQRPIFGGINVLLFYDKSRKHEGVAPLSSINVKDVFGDRYKIYAECKFHTDADGKLMVEINKIADQDW